MKRKKKLEAAVKAMERIRNAAKRIAEEEKEKAIKKQSDAER